MLFFQSSTVMMMVFWLRLIAITSALVQHQFPRPSPSCWKQQPVGASSSVLFASTGNLVDISAPRDTSQLSEWAMNWGVQTSDGFQLAASNNENNGDGRVDYDVFAITNQDLPEGSPVLYVPNELILTGNKARQELGEMSYAAEQRLLNSASSERLSQFYLFLKVLKEYELGVDSLYFPWLNSLARFFANGASMTDFCFGCLPPYAAEVSLKEKQSLRHFEEALQEVSFISATTKANSELTAWAFSVVQTRYYNMPNGDLCIVPLGDYFNHGGTDAQNVVISYDEQGNCYVYASRNIPGGQPLQITYGDPTNPSKLLAKYGFLDESSPATFCKLLIDNPSQELVNMGYDHSRMLFYNDGGISPEVWDVVLFQELAKLTTPQEQQDFYQAHMMGNEELKQQYHEQYFSKSHAALQKHVDYLVTELEELSENSWRKDLTRHPRFPLLMRHNDYVKHIFEAVQENLDNMMFM